MAADSEITEILEDAGDSITVGAVTAPCIFHESDMAAEAPAGGVQYLRRAMALVDALTFPTLKRGDACTVNGDDFTVQFTRLIHEGAVIELTLERA